MRVSSVMRDYIRNLNERYVAHSPPPAPLKAAMPIRASVKWDASRERLQKTFYFEDDKSRYEFVVALMGHEVDTGHHAVFKVDHDQVTVTLTTKDLQHVTELDREFAQFCDTIFKSITNRA